jgi:hypothetical protein
MASPDVRRQPFLPLALALLAGAAIAGVDNLADGGEVSPLGIVVLLFVASAAIGAFCARRRWLYAAALWVWVPGAHLFKHALGLPDTIHPNTLRSILLLAAFTLAVTALGTGAGVLVRRGWVSGNGARGSTGAGESR